MRSPSTDREEGPGLNLEALQYLELSQAEKLAKGNRRERGRYHEAQRRVCKLANSAEAE